MTDPSSSRQAETAIGAKADVDVDVERIELLVATVMQAPKARNVMKEFIGRLCAEELRARPGPEREIVKRVKRALHQVGGAYLSPTPHYGRMLRRLTDAEPGPDRQAAMLSALATHASTRERSHVLADYYAALFAGIETEASDGTIIDVACGLNPLALGEMPIAPARYLACDIYLDLLDFVSRASSVLGTPVDTFAHDLMSGPPDRSADVALLLKCIPCLDQLDPAIGRRLLTGLDATHIVVTYPTRSLGGHDRGMRSFYRDRFHELVAPLDYSTHELDLPVELGFRLTATATPWR